MRELVLLFWTLLLIHIFPKFVDFFFKSTKLRLKKLEKAYKLSNNLNPYCNQICLFNMLYVHCETYGFPIDSLSKIKIVKPPLSKLNTLLNFHLKAPVEIINQLTALEEQVLQVSKPIMPTFLYKSTQKPEINFNDQRKLSVMCKEFQSSLQKWILNERDITLLKMDVFELIKEKCKIVKFWLFEKFQKAINRFRKTEQ
ncbi:MAG TPA: hypothetical protein VFU62_14060 [Hanamia sp.]|nr:hypothetical protein [Hanamia sp.]